MPYDPELQPDLSQGLEPWEGDRRGQENDGFAVRWA